MKGIEGRNFEMLNAEKYKNEILEKLNIHNDFAITEENKRIKSCAGTGCSKCLFNVTGESCTSAMTRWLLSEYKEPTPIKDVLKNCEVVEDAEE